MLQWKLKRYLDSHGITPYKLWKESGLSRPTVYAMAKPETGAALESLNAVIATLTRLTGQPVTPNDLLEVIEEPEHVFEEMDAETKAWHDADLSHLGSYEPYDWGDIDPMTLGKAVINGVVQE